MKKTYDLWGTIKKICIMRLPEEAENEKGAESLTENFPNLGGKCILGIMDLDVHQMLMTS